jgi:peroxiredoxin
MTPLFRPLPVPGWLLGCLLGCLLAATPGAARGGTFNPDRAIGDVVPPWADLPGTDGRRHSWADLADRDFIVVVFTCNSCPYAVDYEDRINALARRLSGPDSRGALVAINSNLVPADSPAAMRDRARAKDYRFPYLFDESQEVARAFGAVRTPEFFLIDRDRRIRYMGALDDDATAARVTRHHLDEAVAATIAGEPIAVPETAPVGCLIRYGRRRAAR